MVKRRRSGKRDGEVIMPQLGLSCFFEGYKGRKGNGGITYKLVIFCARGAALLCVYIVFNCGM
jgi:hypothetical protein